MEMQNPVQSILQRKMSEIVKLYQSQSKQINALNLILSETTIPSVRDETQTALSVITGINERLKKIIYS